MGQIEVYEFLKRMRLNRVHSFFSCRAVKSALKEAGFSEGLLKGVNGDLLKLELSGYLEAKIHNESWTRCWRLKDKYARID